MNRGGFLPFLLALATAGACSAPSATPDSTTPTPDQESRSASPTPEPRAEAPSPEAPTSAVDLLDCDGNPSPMGGLADDFGPDGIGDTPDEAFEAWLQTGIFGVPRSGYERHGSVGNRFVYTYAVEGSVKVVVVISDRFSEWVGGAPFTIEEMRTCDPSEYGGQVNLGPDTRVWTHESSGEILTDIPGPGHCSWQSARMLHIGTPEGTVAKQYLRDPDGVFGGNPGMLSDYAEGVEMPADATFSGYRSADGLELWFTPDDVAAYVVTPDGVERWPRADPPAGCV